MKGISDEFAEANTTGDGLLNFEEFKSFVIRANEGKETRETSDEWITMAWKTFNGYNPDREGISEEELIYCLGEIARPGQLSQPLPKY